VLRVGLVRARHPESASAERGATLAEEEAGRAAALVGGARGMRVELVVHDDARTLARELRPAVLVGGLGDAGDGASCLLLAEVAGGAGALAMNVGCAGDALRGERCARSLFHVAASEAMRRDARRLAHAPADARIELWHHSLEPYGAAQLVERFRAMHGLPMDSPAWAGWFAVKVAAEAFLRAGSADPMAIRAVLERPASRWDGHKGVPLSFRAWDHQLRQPLYVVRGEAATAVPEMRSSAGGSAAERLDALGTGARESGCRWTG
jgi:hypothetical protein